MKKSLTVSDLPSHERPRERLQRHGAEILSEQELLAVILSRGGAGRPVLTLAHELLYRFGNIKGVLDASLEELMHVPGIGLAKAAQLKAARDTARRVQALETAEADKPQRAVSRAADVAEVVRSELHDPKKEHFFVLMLDTRGHLIRTEEVSRGSLNSTVVHPREVFKAATAACAAAVIFVHNHPSGDPEPSDDDIALTRRLVNAGQVMGIPVHDHVIVTEKGFVSLRSRNLI
jgi:DNA repair protein RadC